MNTLSFPPMILTHLTMDNALFYGACESGINKLINTHNLSHLTAVSVATLLKSNQLTPDEIRWIKDIAGLNVSLTEYGYQHGDGCGNGKYGSGYGTGKGYGYGTTYGRGYENGEGYGDGCIDEYGYGYSNGDGEGYGYVDENQPL